MYIPLCVGGSKEIAGQYILYCPLQRAIYLILPSPEGNIQILPGKVVSSNPLNNSLIQSFHSFDPNAVWTAFV